MKNRAARIVLGIMALLILGVYSYIHFSASPFSADMEDVSNKAYEDHYGKKKDGTPIESEEASEEASEADPEAVPEGNPESSPEPTPAPTVDPNSPEGRAAALGLPKPPDIDITSWEFLMANPSHNISEYEPPLYHYETKEMPDNIQSNQSGEGLKVDERIVDPLTTFISAAADQGLNVYLSSAYRPYGEQSYLFNLKVNETGSQEAAAKIVAVPGTSEHQTGLAADITDKYYRYKNASLEETELYKWMSAHCHEYGFIVRFPKDKEDVTQIMYEPWHFRYVGVDAATYIMENGLCYEEFYALYTDE